MKKAYSLYLRTTDNVGDLYASPADHFSFPLEVEKLCVHDCFDLDLSKSFIMLGGGGLIHCGAPGQQMEYLESLCKLSPYMVTWGIVSICSSTSTGNLGIISVINSFPTLTL